MKVQKIIFLFLVVSFPGFSQSDSLSKENNWDKNHAIGLELGGKLEYYSLFYEYSITKGKNNVGAGYGSNYLYTYSNPKYGHTLFLLYKYGEKHSVFLNLFQSFRINFGAFNGKDQSGEIWEQPLPVNKMCGLIIGYNYQPNNSKISIFIGGQLTYYYGKKYNYVGEMESYYRFSPWGNIGLKYNLKQK